MIRGDNHLVLDNMRDDYPKLFQWVHEHGEPVSPHTVLTYELRNFTFTLLDPADSYPYGIGRKEDLSIPALEALQLISGRSDQALMKRVYPTGLAYGSVGERLRWQMTDIEQALLLERYTRQAVASVWDPSYDRIGSPELTCSLSYQFLFRNDTLEMHVHMRSADVAYDAFNFTWSRCQLLLTLCRVLNLRPGPYHLHANSFHLYGRDVSIADTMHKTNVLVRPTDLATGLGEDGGNWQAAADRAKFVLDVAAGRIVEGVNPNAFSPNEKWYLEQLRPYWVAGG